MGQKQQERGRKNGKSEKILRGRSREIVGTDWCAILFCSEGEEHFTIAPLLCTVQSLIVAEQRPLLVKHSKGCALLQGQDLSIPSEDTHFII